MQSLIPGRKTGRGKSGKKGCGQKTCSCCCHGGTKRTRRPVKGRKIFQGPFGGQFFWKESSVNNERYKVYLKPKPKPGAKKKIIPPPPLPQLPKTGQSLIPRRDPLPSAPPEESLLPTDLSPEFGSRRHPVGRKSVIRASRFRGGRRT